MKKFLLAMGLVLALASMGFAQSMDTPAQIAPSATLQMENGIKGEVITKNHYKVTCIREGKVVWTEEFDNLVPTTGLNYLLTAGFKSAGSTTWYVGLVGITSSGFVAGDTQTTHAGWTENTAYTNTAANGTIKRPTLTLGTAGSGSIDNSASTAAFTMIATTTIYGAFIIDAISGVGTNGLYGEGAFTSSRSVNANDVLNVTITLTVTASDAGFYLYEFLEHVAMLTEPFEDFRLAA